MSIVSVEADAKSVYDDLRRSLKAENDNIIRLFDYDPDEAELEVEHQVAMSARRESEVYGLVMLRALWNMVKWSMEYPNRQYTIRYQVNDLCDYVNQYHGGRDMAIRAAHIVEREFVALYKLSEGIDPNGNPNAVVEPFLHPETGEVITPEYFIDQPGKFKSLKIASSHVDKAIKSGDYGAASDLIGKIATSSSSQVQNHIKLLNSSTSHKWRVRREWVTDPETGERKIIPVIDSPMSAQEFAAFMSRLGPFAEELT